MKQNKAIVELVNNKYRVIKLTIIIIILSPQKINDLTYNQDMNTF